MTRLTEDLSQPISVLLRKGTQQAHEAAEHSQGAGWLTRGELDREEYIRFLFMLWNVYSYVRLVIISPFDVLRGTLLTLLPRAMEQGLDEAQSNAILQPTYRPAVLSRTESLSSDIAFLLGTAEWQYHPVYQQYLRSIPQPVTKYTERLRSLSSSPETSGLLLAHAYVRYLGDLSGGQFIRRRIAKVYELPDSGDGIRFYLFSNGNGEDAGPSEIRELKEWYRDGMNAGVGDNEELKEALVDEAVLAFKLNQDLFTVLRGPSNSTNQEQTIPTIPYAEPPTPNTLVPSELVTGSTLRSRKKRINVLFGRPYEVVVLGAVFLMGLFFVTNNWMQ
ncbi:hypothetical protein FRC18_002601 [Serendipita sp. 400]|nr:hypothetical protein FRC18_002601 [Serendipita sp. 400]